MIEQNNQDLDTLPPWVPSSINIFYVELYAVTGCLTTGTHPKKCVIGQLHSCVNNRVCLPRPRWCRSVRGHGCGFLMETRGCHCSKCFTVNSFTSRSSTPQNSGAKYGMVNAETSNAVVYYHFHVPYTVRLCMCHTFLWLVAQ
jgi:hypothetical protein